MFPSHCCGGCWDEVSNSLCPWGSEMTRAQGQPSVHTWWSEKYTFVVLSCWGLGAICYQSITSPILTNTVLIVKLQSCSSILRPGNKTARAHGTEMKTQNDLLWRPVISIPWLHAIPYLCIAPQVVGYFQSTTQTASSPDKLTCLIAIFTSCHGLKLCFESPSLVFTGWESDSTKPILRPLESAVTIP